MPPRVVIAGPASWNHLIVLDRLPEPVPHMQFAQDAWWTIGGTSAGKALHLAGLGIDTLLRAPLGPDADGERIRAALADAGVAVDPLRSERTEQHVNLMTEAGGRVSLYVATPTDPDPADIAATAEAVASAEVAVIDLAMLGLGVIDHPARGATPLWIDLHDYDGEAAFHEPFVRAADVVFMNADATDDPWTLMRTCLDRGPRLAVCTLGAEGAVALEADGTRHRVAAAPVEVVDTNGAGDGFMAGFLAATLEGADVDAALTAAAALASTAIATRHLHPALDAIL